TQQTVTTTGATSSNDSNPSPTTGIASVDLGGPGQNDHTIDAGLVADTYLDVAKAVHGPAPAGQKFQVTVACTDFRGDPLSPATTTMTLAAGEDHSMAVPAGSTCKVTETDAGGADDTTYTVSGGAPAATAPAVPVTGTQQDPTPVVITNTYNPKPAIDIVKYDGRATAPTNPVDGHDPVDDTYGGPTAGDWQPTVDADTKADAATYPMTAGTTGPQPVKMTVTNTGTDDLTDVTVADKTDSGPALTGLTCDFSALGGPSSGVTWAGPFKPGASFPCSASLTLAAAQAHADTASVTAASSFNPQQTVGDEDQYNAISSGVAIDKISHADGAEADTLATGVYVASGGSVAIDMPAKNIGETPLHDIVVTDTTKSGPAMTDFACTFPDGSAGTVQADGSIRWDASFGAQPALWQPGVTFTCTGTLTMPAGSDAHHDTVAIAAVDAIGNRLTDTNDHNDFTASVDIVKYDGRATPPADPVDGPDAVDGKYDGPTVGDWDPKADADTTADAVAYPISGGTTGSQPVKMIVTNTGHTPLADVTVADHTVEGAAVADLSCDFSALGGPATGTTWSGPLAPGASFPCTATLTMSPNQVHADIASVTGTPLNPATGQPTGQTIGDEDQYHATTPNPGGGVDIEKFDEAFGTPTAYDPATVQQDLALDADTASHTVTYEAGVARKVRFAVDNTGQEDLLDLSVSDQRTSGSGTVTDISCDFSPLGGPKTGTTWAGPLKSGEHFYCSGTLTLAAGQDHADRASVTATGAETGHHYGDHDDFHASTPEVEHRATPPPPARTTGQVATPIGSLPRTGVELGSLVLLALALIAAGLLSRRGRAALQRRS
ncbi:MAG TPA: DUF5979 domain-containing protein, partial [Acidimicrobiales bacterium]